MGPRQRPRLAALSGSQLKAPALPGDIYYQVYMCLMLAPRGSAGVQNVSALSQAPVALLMTIILTTYIFR